MNCPGCPTCLRSSPFDDFDLQDYATSNPDFVEMKGGGEEHGGVLNAMTPVRPAAKRASPRTKEFPLPCGQIVCSKTCHHRP
jgi:hypothetical protein